MRGSASVYAECAAELLRAGHSGSGEVRIPVYLSLRRPPPPAGDHGPEAYRLGVAGDGGVEVRAASHAGLVYGIHTLLHLARPRGGTVELPACVIEDWPDFRLRGLQDDPARGQFPRSPATIG